MLLGFALTVLSLKQYCYWDLSCNDLKVSLSKADNSEARMSGTTVLSLPYKLSFLFD